MKKTFIKMLILLLTFQDSFGQYKPFLNASGFVRSQGAVITHIALAGGGVVLKTAAKPKYSDSLLLLTGVTFTEKGTLSTMNIQAGGLNMAYSDTSWLMRDAAMLVKSEKNDTMYREINLLGEIRTGERIPDYIKKQSVDNYYIIEVANSLQNTKSGQTLLYMDIMLSSKANTQYYGFDSLAVTAYLNSQDSLYSPQKAYNDSIYTIYDELVSKEDSLYLLKKSGKIDSGIFKKDINDLRANISKLTIKRSWNDYTYNDENANYTFYYSKNDKRLHIDGIPSYTFLTHDYWGDAEVDSITTNYYIQHSRTIKNINYVVVTNAEHFGKIAAFYRYLKVNYPKLWTQVYTHYLSVIKTRGQTPRFIDKYPPNENYY